MGEPIWVRFWRRVQRAGPDDCWPWTGSTDSGGYGHLLAGSRTDGTRRLVGAHCVAYELAYGVIPKGTEIDHLCRNHVCVNPRHLEAVAHRVNVARGTSRIHLSKAVAEHARRQRALTHCKRGHPFDEANTAIAKNGTRRCRACVAMNMRKYRAHMPKKWSKSTPEAVAEIRRRHAAGESTRSLAEAFNMTPSNVSHIVAGRSWSAE